MSEKQRALPLWMSNKEMKVKKKTPLKSQRKGKTTRALFYCMNEAELVEAAVQCLTSDSLEDNASPTHQQISKKANNTREKVKKHSISMTRLKRMMQISEEEDSDCGGDPDFTRVSETDLDITEVETLPYTRSPEADRSHRNDCTVRNADVEAEEKKEKATDAEHQEDEALRLVRDIFFT